MKKKFIMIFSLVTVFNLLFLTGCQNTVQGFGKDMQHAGQNIQKSASE